MPNNPSRSRKGYTGGGGIAKARKGYVNAQLEVSNKAVTSATSSSTGSTGSSTPYVDPAKYGSASWTPGSISAGGSVSTDITVTGITASSTIAIGAPGLVAGLIVAWAYQSADTVRVLISNPTAAAITGPAGTWRARAWNQ